MLYKLGKLPLCHFSSMTYLTINVLYKRLRFSHKVGVAMIYLTTNVLYKMVNREGHRWLAMTYLTINVLYK